VSDSKGLRLAWPTEKQNISIRIANLKATQTIVRVFERCAEFRATSGEVCGQSVGVLDIDESVQAQVGMTCVVGHGRDAALGLDEDLCAVAADDSEEGVLIGRHEAHLEAELVAVEGDSWLDAGNDEAGRDRLQFWAGHNDEILR